MEEKDVVTTNEPQNEEVQENQVVESDAVAENEVNAETVETQNETVEVETQTEQEKDEISQTEVEAKPVKEKKVKIKKEKPAKVKKEKVVKEEEPQIDEFEGLTDDEIYTKIQTEKLVRRKKNKKIATLVALCVSFALAVCLIVLSVVPVSLKPKCLYEAELAKVEMHNGNGTLWSFDEEHKGETYEKFMELYNESFAQTYIQAIFSGSLFQYEIDEKYDKGADKVLATELKETGKKYFKFEYKEDQVFTRQNGGKYVSSIANKTFDGELKFKEAYVTVNSEEGFQETSIFIVANNYPESSSHGSERVVKVIVRANTNEIYKSWKEIKEIFDKEGV